MCVLWGDVLVLPWLGRGMRLRSQGDALALPGGMRLRSQVSVEGDALALPGGMHLNSQGG